MTWFHQLVEWFQSARFWYIVRPWELALRIRCGKRLQAIGPGIHLRIPFLDEVVIQNVRTRVLNLPVQTVCTAAGKAVTISGIVQWQIADLRQLYEGLQSPEDWIYNAVMAAIAEAVYEVHELTPANIAENAGRALEGIGTEHGLKIQGVSITEFAMVKTYRLITGEGNQGWSWERLGKLQ